MIVVETKPALESVQTCPATCVLVLLAGGTAPSPLSQALGCSLLDLEVAPGLTLLDWWMSREWCVGEQPRVVRTARGAGTPAPRSVSRDQTRPVFGVVQPVIQHHTDAAGPRGSAGALRDVCQADAAGTTILAAESSTVMLAPLEPILASHAESQASVTLVSTTSGRPAGLSLVEREVLDLVKERGYVDFKEQLLPALVKAGRRINLIEVLEEEAVAMHDRQGLLDGLLRIASLIDADSEPSPPPPLFDPRWSRSIVSEFAELDPTAVASASVVLAGARIGAEAVIARSIIGHGAVVHPGEIVIDRIVTAERSWRDEQLPLEARRVKG